MARWLEVQRCGCGCAPMLPGGALLCALLLLRGIYSLLEVYRVINLLIDRHAHWGLSEDLVLACGLCDLVAGSLGLLGLAFRNVLLVQLQVVGVALRLALGSTAIVAFVLDEPDRWADWWHVLAVVVLVAIDVQVLVTSVVVMFVSVWRWTLTEGMRRVALIAQRVAAHRRDPACELRHFLAALLLDGGCRQLLVRTKADLRRLEEDVLLPEDWQIGDLENRFADQLVLGMDAGHAIRAGVRMQTRHADDRLSVEHFVLALCGGGRLSVHLGGGRGQPEWAHYDVSAEGVRQEIQVLRTSQQDRVGPVPAPIFGCLPLEETVKLYTMARVVLSAASLLTIFVWGKSLTAILMGLRRIVSETFVLTLVATTLSLILNYAGLEAIRGHQNARLAVRDASMQYGARPDAPLGAAFDLVREHPRSEAWSDQLKASATQLNGLVLWAWAELALDLPLIGMNLVQGNVCDSYRFGITAASRSTLVSEGVHMPVPMHCGHSDFALLFVIVAFLAVKLYMCWAIMALWHQYAFGWTTTESRGAPYLDPLVLGSFWPMLAGGAKRARAGMGEEEAQPLLKAPHQA